MREAHQAQPYELNYNGTLRPQLHFSPPMNWMNDPNGLFYYDGLFHLYFQWSYTSIYPSSPSWGHATSPDLYTWSMHSIAIYNTSEEAIYTGSVVFDVENTSGLFPSNNPSTQPNVVAVYTQHTAVEEAQAIAVSQDGGSTFGKYIGNPVLSHGIPNFRDPKVIWHQDRWVMAVARAADGFISFYTSPDLIDWTAASNFIIPGGLPGSYECPKMVPIPVVSRGADGRETTTTMHILIISFGSGSPFSSGESVVRYFPGTFDGAVFTPVDDHTDRYLDFGPDFYATSVFTNAPSESILTMSWAAGLSYCTAVPTGPREGWVGMMTTARESYLRAPDPLGGRDDWVYISRPANLDKIRDKVLASSENSGSPNFVAAYDADVDGVLLEGTFRLQAGKTLPATGDAVNITFAASSSQTGEAVTCLLSFSAAGVTFLCDRSDAIGDWSPPAGFGARMGIAGLAPLIGTVDTWTMQVIVDRSILEVFLNDGEKAGTMTYFPAGLIDTLAASWVGTESTLLVELTLSSLSNGWAN